MPAAFDRCRKGGGTIKTKRIDKTHYMHICIPRGGGKGDSVGGEVKTYKNILRGKKT